MRKIGISIPTMNRFEMTIRSFAQVLDDERIESITIVDDASIDGSFEKLCDYFHDNDKVIIYSNLKNLDCYANKREAVLESKSEWVALWDSDNIFGTDYLDAIYAIENWDEHTFYLPEFARPAFSAKQWSGLVITKENVGQYINTHLMTNLNAMNFFINRREYLKVWDGSVNAGSSDSIYFSLCWLEAGNSIMVTPNLEYQHTLHNDGSGHYTQNSRNFVDFHKSVMQKIRELK